MTLKATVTCDMPGCDVAGLVAVSSMDLPTGWQRLREDRQHQMGVSHTFDLCPAHRLGELHGGA